jgi:uncharacterized membrane protein YhaH (DUF805 family)
MFSFRRGRSDRKQYWLMAAVFVATVAAFSMLLPQYGRYGGAGGLVVWTMIYGRRLHDIGRSAWWQVIPLGLSLALAIYGFTQSDAPALLFEANGGDDPGRSHIELTLTEDPMSGPTPWLMASLAIQAVFTVVLGILPGERGENRFGPPPGTASQAA